MSTAAVLPETKAPVAEQRVVLRDVTWDLYERMISEIIDQPGKRVAYWDGALEIMVVSSAHEYLNRMLARLVEVAAEETGRDLLPSGSTTFKRSDLHAGFEPDSSYYLENAPAVRGKKQIDLAVDVPPDLVIEIDLSSDSLDKLALFAALGIQEVWRYSKQRVRMLRLAGGKYVETARSGVLPPLTVEAADRFLERSNEMNAIAWLREVREWVRGANSSPSS
jgi:Uma2 family endonuclease